MGWSWPSISLSRVLLPEPLLPIRPMRSPRSTWVVSSRISGGWPGQAKLTLSSSSTRLRDASAVSSWKLALPCRSLRRARSPHPAFVTGAPGLDALADPGFLLGQLLVEQRIGRRLGLQLLLLVLEEAAVVSLPVDQLTAVQLQDPRRQGLQELPVVGDEEDRA